MHCCGLFVGISGWNSKCKLALVLGRGHCVLKISASLIDLIVLRENRLVSRFKNFYNDKKLRVILNIYVWLIFCFDTRAPISVKISLSGERFVIEWITNRTYYCFYFCVCCLIYLKSLLLITFVKLMMSRLIQSWNSEYVLISCL